MNLDFEELNRILIANDTDAIIANIVYLPIDGGYIGAYSGNSGGVFDYRVFYVDEDEAAQIDDDFEALNTPNILSEQEIFSALEGERFKLEDPDKEGFLSSVGLQFLASGEQVDTGLKVKYSDGASEDIIYALQEDWTLNYFLE